MVARSTYAKANNRRDPRTTTRQGVIEQGLARPLQVGVAYHPLLHLPRRPGAQLPDLGRRHGLQPAHGLRVPATAQLLVDNFVVFGKVQALLACRLQCLRAPQDATGVVTPRSGEHEDLLNAYILEATVDPGRHAGDIPRRQRRFERIGVEAPMQIPAALGAHEDLGGEMHVRWVARTRWHGNTTDLKAVFPTQADRLVRVL